MSKYLYRLGHVAVRRRWVVLLGWIGALVGVAVLSVAAGGQTSEAFTIPGTESQVAADLLTERFPAQAGSEARIVFAAPDGSSVHDEANRTAIVDAVDAIAASPGVLGVSDALAAGTVSPNEDVAFVTARFGVDAPEVTDVEVESLLVAANSAEQAGLRVELGGEVIDAHGEEMGHTSELIGLGVAVIVLLVSFGSLIAMSLPLVTALIGVGITMTGITLMSAFVDLSSTTPVLALMIGLAVGIDYALFIVTRHRQNLAEGFDVAESAARANATAGGAVVFAGVTVVIALAGLMVVGIPFLTVMGLAAASSVVIAIAVAITLIPALLGFSGHNIDRWRVGRARTGSADESHTTMSARWARGVTKRPGLALAGGLGVMLLLALPMLDMRLGMTDAGTQPPSTTQRQAYDLLADSFGPGFNGPLVLVADLSGVSDPDAALDQVRAAVAGDPGVLAVGEAMTNPQGDTAVISVIPRSGPSSEDTERLVHHLRGDIVPSLEADSGVSVAVAGTTAANIDISDKMSDALPVFMVLVIGLTVLLLLVVFRSVIVPIKAAIAILLSIGASFGVLVAIFQWGWFMGLVGLEETVPIISFLPMMMFAILFGLSMDYEVFIMSRVREDYVRSGEARQSVLTGLTSSARVITAAALIMISVFGSFVLGDDPIIKMFGIGLATAVFLDATVVRMMLVPAAMALFDKAAWWLPRWLDRALPNLDVEGEHLIEQLDAASGSGGDADGDVVDRERDLTLV